VKREWLRQHRSGAAAQFRCVIRILASMEERPLLHTTSLAYSGMCASLKPRFSRGS
jgi:hypothetical protein